MCIAHLNDKMHLEGVRGLIRNKLIELPAMQNMEKSGRFSIKGDKEISYRKDDAGLQVSAKISPGPSVSDCPYLLERAQPLNTSQVCHDESRWKRWAGWCLCIGVISIDLYGSLILLIPIIWLQFWWFLLYIQCIQKVFTGLQLSCDVTVLFENWLNWFLTWKYSLKPK